MLRRSHFNGSIVAGGELGGPAIGAPSVADTGEIRWRRTDSAMTKSQRVFSVPAAVLLLAAMAACGSGSNPDSSPTPSPSVTESSPASPSETASPEDAASAASIALVQDYYTVTDLLLQDASVPLTRLESVATSSQLSAQQTFLKGERKAGTTQAGDTEIVETKIQSVSLDNSDPTAGRVPSVTIDACWDVSDVDVLDADGKSIITTDRPDRGWTRLTVANYSWDADPEGSWRVASGEDLEKTPCEG